LNVNEVLLAVREVPDSVLGPEAGNLNVHTTQTSNSSQMQPFTEH